MSIISVSIDSQPFQILLKLFALEMGNRKCRQNQSKEINLTNFNRLPHKFEVYVAVKSIEALFYALWEYQSMLIGNNSP